MTGMEKIYPDILVTANEIKNRIKNELGFTVNIGVGSNKLLAKMASDFEKPDKVHTLFDYEFQDKVWHLPVGSLFSVGESTAQKLERSCIKTVGELAHIDVSVLKSLLGVKMGEHLHNFANGIDDSPVLENREKAKGYSNSVTLEYDVKSIAEANKILLALADSTAARMRADSVKTRCISVTIRDIDFNDKSHQRKLNSATDITTEIFDICKILIKELWDTKKPLRLLGVSLTDVTDENDIQLSMFDSDKKDKERAIDRTVDSIRNRFGKDTIVRGGIYKNNIEIGKKNKK
jgi:DNA polymerase-4